MVRPWMLSCALCGATGLLAAPVAAMSEHQAMLDLVPLGQVTHSAVSSGNWSSAATWSGGVLPGANARVWIPAGLSVNFDLQPSPELRTVRVDGLLRWATNIDTELRVDTLVVMGSLWIGTQDAPIASGVNARVVFTDSGTIDPLSDPTLVGRGLLSMGTVRIWGEARYPRFVQLAGAQAAGSSQLQLAAQPHGWRAGDTVVLAGTRYTGVLQTLPMLSSEDEIRSIASIKGDQLQLDQPLQFSHSGPAGHPWARAHVANLNCNIVFDSAAGALTPISRRGHIMLMVQDVQIENVCLYNLGRTDKSRAIDDPVVNLDGTPGTGSNPRGRYSLHFHKVGTNHQLNWMQPPAKLRGCVVRNNPGWGIAIHQSHAVVEDCVSHQVFGAHFVTEDGNEQGAFRRNIAIWAPGDTADRGYKGGTANHDLGHSGCGFWIQGRDFGVEGNVASGMGDGGFCWFHRSEIWNAENPMRVFVANLSQPLRKLLHLRTPLTVAGTEYGEFNYNDVPIGQVRDNLSYASGTAYRVTKSNPLQLGDQFSFLSGLRSFNTEEGLFHEYTQHYFYDQLQLVGMEPDNLFRNGITSWSLADHLVFRDVQISNFGNCLRTGLFFSGSAGMVNDHPNVLLLDRQFGPCVNEWLNFLPGNPRGARQLSLSSAQLTGAPLSFTPDPGQSFQLAFASTDFVLSGTVNDGSGSWPLRVEWGAGGPLLLEHLLSEGYFTRADGSRVVRLETRMHSRADPNQTLDYVFELAIPNPYGLPLGPNNGPLPPYVENHPPIASNHDYLVHASAGWRIDVQAAQGLLIDASDDDIDSLQVYLSQIEPPQYGTVSIAPNGGFMYRRTVHSHNLPDHFRYRLHDTRDGSNWATVNLIVDDKAVPLFADGFEDE